MADTTTNTANKVVAPMDKPIENGPPTPPETQPSLDTKLPEPGLPPIAKEPMATAQAPMIPAPIDTTEADLTSAPIASTDAAKSSDDAKNDAAKASVAESGLAAQPDKPDALEDTNATSDGASKEVPKPVSVQEVPDQELAASKPLGAGNVTQPADEKEETVPPLAKKADLPDAELTTGTVPKEDAQFTGPAQAVAETAKVEPQTGDKRKADSPAEHEETNGDASNANVDEKDDSPAKKQKTEDNEIAATNGENTGVNKRGRPKKEKKPPAPVGRTARKTRSQAAAEQ
ncbi:hypothetical protein PG990_005664 [Apiospora arundinis]